MNTKKAKTIIAVAVLVTGMVVGWRGISAWRQRCPGCDAQSTAPALPATTAPAPAADAPRPGASFVWNDAEAIDPAENLQQAAEQLQEAIESSALRSPPGPADLWRPRLQDLAQRAVRRMQAIWTGDEEALASLSREEGATPIEDTDALSQEQLRHARSWADSWGLAPVSKQVHVRFGAAGQPFKPPLPPPVSTIRNRLKPWFEEPAPDATVVEVLFPAKPKTADTRQPLQDVVWLGFLYAWSDEEQRWRFITTSMYAPSRATTREAGIREARRLVAPP